MFRINLTDPTVTTNYDYITSPQYGQVKAILTENTIVFGQWLANYVSANRLADLTAHNGEIAKAIKGVTTKYLGDDTLDIYKYFGPVEETIDKLPKPVDIFILAETIERTEDPEALLTQIRNKSTSLVLSTPISENNLTQSNHIWGWDREAVEAMLSSTGWQIVSSADVFVPDTYGYQIYAAV